MLQNKETIVQNYRKISNESSKKSHGIEFALFSGTVEIGMDNFDYLNNSLYLFLFCDEPAKNVYGVHTPSAVRPPLPHISQCAFSWTPPPPPSVCTLWITLKIIHPFKGRKHLRT